MPRTLEVFHDLGVIGAVLALGGAYPPFRGYHGETVLWDRTIHQVGGFPLLEALPDVRYPQFWMMPQWRTEEILRDRVAELGGRVELGTEITAMTHDADGSPPRWERANRSGTASWSGRTAAIASSERRPVYRSWARPTRPTARSSPT
jgi:2-polyprenyl-6-methoxyphenol hydroxylase-like FAD-dependent oxidoreductase